VKKLCFYCLNANKKLLIELFANFLKLLVNHSPISFLFEIHILSSFVQEIPSPPYNCG
jgi:hypothetical protein